MEIFPNSMSTSANGNHFDEPSVGGRRKLWKVNNKKRTVTDLKENENVKKKIHV